MWLGRKTKAFTILELVITLLISSILFGAAYLLLGTVQSYYKRFSDTNRQALEVNSFRHALATDFYDSRYVLLTADGVICYGDSMATAYTFEEDRILRQVHMSEGIDTFHFNLGEFEPRYSAQRVLMPGSLVEFLTVYVYTAEDTFKVHVQRPYAAEEKINLNFLK